MDICLDCCTTTTIAREVSCITNLETQLAVLILEHPDSFLRIEIEDDDPFEMHEGVERMIEIVEVTEAKGLLLDDVYYVQHKSYEQFKSYMIGNTKLGDPIPDEETMRRRYDQLPWEDIVYVYARREGTEKC